MSTPEFRERDCLTLFRALLPSNWEVRVSEPRRSSPWDLTLELLPHGPRLGLAIRKDPRARNFPFGLDEKEDVDVFPVLAARRVPLRLQEILRKHGWGWIDGAGNGWISIPGKLLVERTGHAPLPQGPGEMDLGSAVGLQLIRILLHPSNASRSWTLRELQRECGRWDPGTKEPSLGYLSRFIGFLLEEAYVNRRGPRAPITVQDEEGLLRASAAEYAVQQVQCFSVQPRSKLELGLMQIEQSSGGYAAWAAFSAADLLAPAVQTNKHWIMVASRHLDDLQTVLEAKEVDEGANLVILVPEEDGPFFLGEKETGRAQCTSPVQTYWDLCHSGGRGPEAAEAILNQVLLPAWKNGAER